MSYPKHKYSNYVDQQFSFNNTVYPNKIDTVDALKNIRMDGSIMLEPRLQEYLRKKKYYRDNNIEECISLEREFSITSRDKRFLREFLKGNRDMYTTGKHNELLESPKQQKRQVFPSTKLGLLNDERVPVINNQKLYSNKPVNRGMFAPDDGRNKMETYYEDPIDNDTDLILDARDITGFDVNTVRFTPSTDWRVDQRPGPQHKKRDSQYRIDPVKKFSIKSSLEEKRRKEKSYYDQYMKDFLTEDKCDYESYDQKGMFSHCLTLEDTNSQPNPIPKSKKELSTQDYRLAPFFGDNDNFSTKSATGFNAEVESSMIHGMPVRTTRSYGYRNPAEHYFDYIDDDFQNPDQSVLPFPRGGESSRLDNKKSARQKYVRDIM